MSGPARLVIQITTDDDLVVHEFRRVTSQPTVDGIRGLTRAASGWLQAWGDQVTEGQWANDVARAREAQGRS